MIRSSDTSLSGSCVAARSRWRRACGGSLVIAGFFAIPADAQELPDLQRELREMRQHYDAELKRLRRDYEARIDRLEKQVKAADGTATPAPAPHPPGARCKCWRRATSGARLAAASPPCSGWPSGPCECVQPIDR